MVILKWKKSFFAVIGHLSIYFYQDLSYFFQSPLKIHLQGDFFFENWGKNGRKCWKWSVFFFEIIFRFSRLFFETKTKNNFFGKMAKKRKKIENEKRKMPNPVRKTDWKQAYIHVFGRAAASKSCPWFSPQSWRCGAPRAVLNSADDAAHRKLTLSNLPPLMNERL